MEVLRKGKSWRLLKEFRHKAYGVDSDGLSMTLYRRCWGVIKPPSVWKHRKIFNASGIACIPREERSRVYRLQVHKLRGSFYYIVVQLLTMVMGKQTTTTQLKVTQGGRILMQERLQMGVSSMSMKTLDHANGKCWHLLIIVVLVFVDW